MSTPSNIVRDGSGRAHAPAAREREERVPVASFEAYVDAERAVDRLAQREFPVENVTIVARGVRWVERVTGRETSRSASLTGAASGALTGALVGLFLGVFSISDPLQVGVVLGLYGLLLGGLLGALLGLWQRAPLGGRRDFYSTSGLEADAFDVLVDAALADEAARLLRADSDGGGGTKP